MPIHLVPVTAKCSLDGMELRELLCGVEDDCRQIKDQITSLQYLFID